MSEPFSTPASRPAAPQIDASLILSLLWEEQPDFWTRALTALASRVDSSGKGFLLLLDPQGELRPAAHIGLDPEEERLVAALAPARWRQLPFLEEVFAGGRESVRLVAADPAQFAELAPLVRDRSALLLAVLRGAARPVGVAVLLLSKPPAGGVPSELAAMSDAVSRLWTRLVRGPEAEDARQELELLRLLEKNAGEGDLGNLLREALPLLGGRFLTLFRVEGEELVTEFALGGPANFQGQRLPKGRGLAGRVAETGESIVIDDSLGDSRVDADSFLRATGSTSSVTVPLFHRREVIGVLGVGRPGPEPFRKGELERIRLLAAHLERRLGREQEIREERIRNAALIRSLSQVVDSRDPYTGQHSESVTRYARLIAREMNLDAETIEDLTVAALLHDLGKLGIPDSLWTKNEPPSREEVLLMRSHPVLGASILDKGPERWARVAGLVRHHHERWDGRGYPDGLAGAEIPLPAAILAVADAFDAMLSPRPYRRPLTRREALDELRRGAGTQFMPEAVEALIRAVETEADKEEPEPLAPVAMPMRIFGSLEMLRQMSERIDQLLTNPETLLRETLLGLRDSLLTQGGVILRLDGEKLGAVTAVGDWLAGDPPCYTKPRAVCRQARDRTLSLAEISRECPEAPVPGAEIVSPLRHREDLLGWMIMRRGQPFNFQEAQLFSDLSDYLARALSVALNYEEMVQEATHDYLTGALTRRSLFERFREEISRAQRHEHPLTIAITDLDHLKEINDNFGHQAGDETLVDFCEGLRHSLRQEDSLGRYGGDEFVILFPETALDGAERSLQRALDRFRREARLRRHGLAPSFSWGLALFPDDGASPDELLAVADRRLYQQKARSSVPFGPGA